MPRKRKAAEKSRAASEQVIEQFGVRLPKDLIDRIRIASATRKAKCVEPQTLAEIAAEALRQWCDRNSH